MYDDRGDFIQRVQIALDSLGIDLITARVLVEDIQTILEPRPFGFEVFVMRDRLLDKQLLIKVDESTDMCWYVTLDNNDRECCQPYIGSTASEVIVLELVHRLIQVDFDITQELLDPIDISKTRLPQGIKQTP